VRTRPTPLWVQDLGGRSDAHRCGDALDALPQPRLLAPADPNPRRAEAVAAASDEQAARQRTGQQQADPPDLHQRQSALTPGGGGQGDVQSEDRGERAERQRVETRQEGERLRGAKKRAHGGTSYWIARSPPLSFMGNTPSWQVPLSCKTAFRTLSDNERERTWRNR
jgi:hypothetical protein